MTSWEQAWIAIGVLAAGGLIGLVAAHSPGTRRWVGPWCFTMLIGSLAAWPERPTINAPASVSFEPFDLLAFGTWLLTALWGGLLLLLGGSDQPESESKSTPAAEPRCIAEQRAVTLLLVAGVNLMALAGDLGSLYLGLSLICLGSGVLVRVDSADESVRREELDRANPLWSGLLFSACLLFGFVLLYALTGATRLETIRAALVTSYTPSDVRHAAGGGSHVLRLSVVFVGAGLAGFAGVVPFHWRQARTVATTQSLAATVVLLFPRAAATLVGMRLWPIISIGSGETAPLLLGVLATLTFVAPLFQARRELEVMQLLTHIVIAQGGWLLMGWAVLCFGDALAATNLDPQIAEWNLPPGAEGVWFWLLLDGAAVIGLAGVSAYLRRRERRCLYVEDLQGLWHAEPLAAGCASACWLSLAGLPLLGGFWSRLFLAMHAMQVRGEWGPPQMLVPHTGLLVLAIVAAMSSVGTFVVVGRVVWTMLFDMPLGRPQPSGGQWTLFAAVLVSLFLIGCGLLPGPLLSWLCAPTK